MTEDELFFAVFCIEYVADELRTTGDVVYKMMTDESDTLDNYVIPCYDALHTQGKDYIVHDIIDYMKSRKVRL
ncbi:MAG: DUF3791 domain-containing protein [Clostridiales bacterium]|jgi:hypothetical protein|nr:DUF3791 domain-containing protein [Clostridiales bacterium]